MEEETLEVRKIYLSYKHSKLGALKEGNVFRNDRDENSLHLDLFIQVYFN